MTKISICYNLCMIDFNKNNLSYSSSPYLLQNSSSPVNWQLWDDETLKFALKEQKLIFLSIGYSSCHWCHIMEKEVFSNSDVYNFINKNFVPIKVDREERPDIDNYFITFITYLEGNAGWPLNVILSPDKKPIYAFTYAPVETKPGMYGILDILKTVINSYNENKEVASDFEFKTKVFEDDNEVKILQNIGAFFDWEFAGFGKGAKFIYSSTLLFLIYYYASGITKDIYLEKMITDNLKAIFFSGIFDHLQGGVFRYTEDRQWKFPHFEKMLYDQGLLLWIYSISYHTFKDPLYKEAAIKILKSILYEFKNNGLFYSSINADFSGIEGGYYLWDYEELKKALTEEEFKKLSAVYNIKKEGNYKKGTIHLIKNSETKINIDDIEKKLLAIRKKRGIPEIDKKIITSWNAIVGIGLIHYFRYIKEDITEEEIKSFLNTLLENMYKDKILLHSSTNSKEEFIEDYLFLILFLIFYNEEFNEKKELIFELFNNLNKFKIGENFYQSTSYNFIKVPINSFDNPIPSHYSLLEMIKVRKDILTNSDYATSSFKKSMVHDFYNIAIMIRNGYFHIIESPEKMDWLSLPINCIQKRGEKIIHCYKGTCTEGKINIKK